MSSRAPTRTGALPGTLSAAARPNRSRALRLRAFELLIFVVLAILLAMCLSVAPLVTALSARTEEPAPAFEERAL